MAAADGNLIDDQDLKLTADEISTKALRFVQSTGTAPIDDARKELGQARCRAHVSSQGLASPEASTLAIMKWYGGAECSRVEAKTRR